MDNQPIGLSEIGLVKRRLAALRELKKNIAWLTIVDTMRQEIETANRKDAASPVDADKSNYMRGVFNAAYSFLDIPDRLIAAYENELLIHASKQKDEVEDEDA